MPLRPARLSLGLMCAHLALLCAGCYSPYHADRGALLGGLTGAGVGAVVGNAVGNTGAGALIGGGVGALTGGAIGQGFDEMEARNRAAIAAQLGRQVPPGAVTVDDVMAMNRAGVQPELIVGHIRANGMAQRLTPQDLIVLEQQKVNPQIVQAMQAPPPNPVGPPVPGGPPPMVVAAPYYGPPYWGPPYYYPPPPPPPPVGVSWGVGLR